MVAFVRDLNASYIVTIQVNDVSSPTFTRAWATAVENPNEKSEADGDDQQCEGGSQTHFVYCRRTAQTAVPRIATSNGMPITVRNRMRSI